MALTTIAGTIVVPSGAAPDSARLLFTLVSWDEGGEVVYAPDPIEEVLIGNAYSVALESTTDKVRQCVYKVELSWYSKAKRTTLVEALGVIAVAPSGGPFSLPDLLAAPITDPVPADILALATAAAASASASAILAQSAAAGLAIYAIPNYLYLAWGGQSNSLGSSVIALGDGDYADWITESGKVFVLVPSTGTWVDAVGRQGMEPFNADGSNNAGVHAALGLANQYGVAVRMVMFSQGSTEIEQWTGGGYVAGVPRVTDRTISGSNRVQFKKLTDAVTAMSIPQFHAFDWWQGEADLDTPPDIYAAELDYLIDQVKAAGTAPVATRHMVTAIHGLYTGYKQSQQSRRTVTLERYCRTNPEKAVYVTSMGLVGRDDTPGPTGIINHFSSPAYKIAGERAAQAIIGAWFGASALEDQRLVGVEIPASGLEDQRIGHRSYEMTATTSGTLSLLVTSGQMRGETYPLSGTVTVNMDGNANNTLGDAGLWFWFTIAANSDSILFKSDDGAGNTRQILQSGEDGAVAGGTGITLTGSAGAGFARYEGSRWRITFFPAVAHSQAVIEGGTVASRRMVSPLELRQAANAAILARAGYQTLATDANASPSVSNGAHLLHTGTLTANRILSLTQTNVYLGARMRVTRTGTGAFTLTVRDNVATGNAKALSTGQWVDFVHNGTAWEQSAFGSL